MQFRIKYALFNYMSVGKLTQCDPIQFTLSYFGVFEFLSEFNSFSPQYLQNAQSVGLGFLYFTFKPKSCLSLQPVSVRGLYRLLWLDPWSTTLADRLILWHSDALNARTESSLAACISQQSLQTHMACRSSCGFGVSCLESCLVVGAMSGSATAQSSNQTRWANTGPCI